MAGELPGIPRISTPSSGQCPESISFLPSSCSSLTVPWPRSGNKKKKRGLPLRKGRLCTVLGFLIPGTRLYMPPDLETGLLADRRPLYIPASYMKERSGIFRYGAALAGSHQVTVCIPDPHPKHLSRCGTPPVCEVTSGAICHARTIIPPVGRSTVIQIDRPVGGCIECRLQVLPDLDGLVDETRSCSKAGVFCDFYMRE